MDMRYDLNFALLQRERLTCGAAICGWILFYVWRRPVEVEAVSVDFYTKDVPVSAAGGGQGWGQI